MWRLIDSILGGIPVERPVLVVFDNLCVENCQQDSSQVPQASRNFPRHPEGKCWSSKKHTETPKFISYLHVQGIDIEFICIYLWVIYSSSGGSWQLDCVCFFSVRSGAHDGSRWWEHMNQIAWYTLPEIDLQQRIGPEPMLTSRIMGSLL